MQETVISHYTGIDKLLVAVDCIIFGFERDQLKLLLFKRKIEPFKNKWSLVGRFVKPDEDIRMAASNVLYDYTGLQEIFLEQLFAFGKVKRDSAGRVISIVYYALIRINDYEKKIVQEYDSQWFNIEEVPDLILDHEKMLNKARQKLIEKVKHYPIGLELLPDKFTLPQIFNLYQSIYGRKLDDRNFRKKLLALGVLDKLPEKDKSSSKKGAFLYKFNRERYNILIEEGINFSI